MRLNAHGQALGGVGSGPVTVNGQPVLVHGQPVVGGGPASWLDAQTILVNSPVLGPWALVQIPLATPDAASVLLPGGANKLVAGGGRYLAWISAKLGVVGSLGDLPQAGVRGAGVDGTLAYTSSYATGTDLVFVGPDGQTHTLSPAIVLDDYALQVIGPSQAVWYGQSVGVQVLGVPMPTLACPPQKIRRVVTGDGEVWWIYASGDRGLAQLDGASDGYVLSTGGTFYNVDAIGVNGEIVVAWSVTQGEAPSDVRVITIDRSQPRVPLAQPLVQPTFHFDHPVLVAPFFATGSGQADLFTYGTYSEDPAPVLPPSGRLILGHDARTDWILPTNLRPYDIPILEWYQDPADGGLAGSIARWTAQTQKLLQQWPYVCGGIPMFYTQNRWSIQQVLDGLQAVSQLVNLSPRVQLLAPFAYNRANGIVAFPDLQTAFQALLTEQARVGVASLPPTTGATLESHPMQAFHGYAQVVSLHGGPYYTGVDPSASSKVYYNRPNEPNQGGTWEEIAFTPHDDGGWDACYVAANVGLSIQDDGTLQTRKAGTYGSFEALQIRTESGTGKLLGYRTMDGGTILLIVPKT